MATVEAPGLTRRPLLRRLARYAMASVVGVVVGQSCLFTFYEVLDQPAWLANLLAVAISSVPAYLINRYWVWQKRDRNDLRREVLPFWAMAFLGLLLSTLTVSLADDRTDWAPAILAANLAGFGVLWIAKFFVLDKILFAERASEAHLEPPPIL
jgi:putative flippase GtrA